MEKSEVLETSIRAQPVPQDVLMDLERQEFYNPMQTRDEGGRFEDEGKGSEEAGYRHPDEAGLTGLDKRLVDYRMERPLARSSEDVKSVRHYVPNMHYVRYTKAPFFDELNEAQGTPNPKDMRIEDFTAARARLFSTRPTERLKIKDLIATQPVVNGAKVKKNAKEGKIKNASVVKYGGKYYIVDGHHAVMAAARNGKHHVNANVVHLEEHLPEHKFYREDQARDEKGRFEDEGRGDIEHGGPDIETKVTKEQKAPPKEVPPEVSKKVVDAASKIGFGGEVHVVDEPPREFKVGDRTFNEAGHYDPSDGSITINMRNTSDEFMPHLVSHEVMHDKWAAIEAMRTKEHQEMHDMGHEAFDAMFRASGEPRDEAARAEMERRWPASALFGKTIGDGYLELGSDIAGMKIDDGVTDYSRAYWSPEAQNKQGAYWNAINETLAEMSYLKSKGLLVESPRSGDIARKQLEGMGYKIKRAHDGEPYIVNKYSDSAVVYKANSKIAKLVKSMKNSWKKGSQYMGAMARLGGKVQPSSEWNQLFQGINRLYDPMWRVMRKKA